VWHDVLTYVIGGLLLMGVTALLMVGKNLAHVPQQMVVNQAALFRLLRSNKLQGTALQKIAVALKSGCTNGEADDAVRAVGMDQSKTDEFFKRIALTPKAKLEELLKEDE
jgi:hypothetical protein